MAGYRDMIGRIEAIDICLFQTILTPLPSLSLLPGPNSSRQRDGIIFLFKSILPKRSDRMSHLKRKEKLALLLCALCLAAAAVALIAANQLQDRKSVV